MAGHRSLWISSHVILDAIIYHDVEIWFPWPDDKPLLGIMTFEQMHLFCLPSAAIGAVVYFSIQAFIFKRPIKRFDQLR